MALALATPEWTPALIMASTNWLNIPTICKKRLTHEVGLTAAAIQRDTARNHQLQVLLPHRVDYLAKLLCGSRKVGYFQHSDAIITAYFL